MQKALLRGMLFGILLFTTGCGVTDLEIPDDFFERDGDVAMVWTAELPHGKFRRIGSRGLLDMLVNTAFQGPLTDHVTTVSLQPLTEAHYIQPYSEAISERGMVAKVVTLPLDKEKLHSPEISDKQENADYSKYDFTPFKDSHDVDYVMWLNVEFFGIEQSYYGTIATSEPYGHSKITVYLVSTEDNRLVARYHSEKKIMSVDNWNDPPEFESMLNAVRDSMIRALKTAYLGFFDDSDEAEEL